MVTDVTRPMMTLRQRERRAFRTAYLYILPAALIMTIITFFPLIYQFWMSATNYSNLNLRTSSLFGQILGSFAPSVAERYNSPQFIGIRNYVRVIGNSLSQILSGFDFWRILLFNMVWTFSQVTCHVVIGVGVAMLLSQKFLWFKRIYRALFIIPWALPSLVSAMIWKNMFDDQFGSVNRVLGMLGLADNVRWLQQIDPPAAWIPPFVRLPDGANPWSALLLLLILWVAPLFVRRFRQRIWLWIPWALLVQIAFLLPGGANGTVTGLGEMFPLSFYAVFIANVWLGWPFMMTVATGALTGIPRDFYEAAEIDGATRWQQFWGITAPLLRPAMVPAIMIGIMMTFNQFNIIYFVTGGGPLHQTEILVTQAYRFVNETTINLEGAGNVRPYAVAAAFSYIIFGVLALITLITNRISRATEAYNE